MRIKTLKTLENIAHTIIGVAVGGGIVGIPIMFLTGKDSDSIMRACVYTVALTAAGVILGALSYSKRFEEELRQDQYHSDYVGRINKK